MRASRVGCPVLAGWDIEATCSSRPARCPHLLEEAWRSVAARFTMGPSIPAAWPKPDLLSVCISPDFVGAGLRRTLVRRLSGPPMGQ